MFRISDPKARFQEYMAMKVATPIFYPKAQLVTVVLVRSISLFLPGPAWKTC
jgi:hypothetical protein